MARGKAVAIELSETERGELDALLRRHGTTQAVALRARIVLLAAEGLTNTAIAGRLGIDQHTAGKWRHRFARDRRDGLHDEPRPGAPRQIGDDPIAETIRRTLETLPAGATHWSLRSMAKVAGYAPSTIHRIWQAFGLQPHRQETFKLSTDPLFVEKVRDIVGLYLHPPDRAVVLCVDEKLPWLPGPILVVGPEREEIQALDRTQPLLPLRPGQVERRTHDYKRHGTTSLFAALDVAAGNVIGRCFPRHRAQEFRRFLDAIETNVPADLEVHVVLDNAGSHKTKLIRDWLAKRPRWHVHFTPTSASWLNQVERFFGSLTERALRRGVHRSTTQLEAAIHAYIDAHNAAPKPFRWTKSAHDILANIQRFCTRTLEAHGLQRTSESRH
jgi:transposase